MSTSQTLREKLARLLQELEPINREKVHDLPDEPDRNTIYTLEQEWVCLNGEWVRMG